MADAVPPSPVIAQHGVTLGVEVPGHALGHAGSQGHAVFLRGGHESGEKAFQPVGSVFVMLET